MASPTRTARTALLREVLDIALAVAKQVARDGSSPVPPVLRPALGMARVTSRARADVDRAGDDDDFRARVAEVVGADELDEAGRLWLTRPDGWEEALDALVRERVEQGAQDDARRALDGERRARERAEGERDRLRAEAERAGDALRRAQDDRTTATAALAATEGRAAVAADERTEAIRQLKEAEGRNAGLHTQVKDLRAERDAALAATTAPAVAVPEPAPPPPRQPAPPPAPPVADEGPVVAPSPPFDQDAAARAVGVASAAAAQMAGALDQLSALLRPAAAGSGPGRDVADPDEEVGRRGRGLGARRPPPGPRRRPAPLPGGIHDDSAEAADHLVRLAGCVLLVDGYNASIETWGEHDLPEQRRRLVDALDRLEARAGPDTTVVFDGVEERWQRSPSRRVHVRFTDAGVEADDVILEMVGHVDLGRPVVVASDDARVREGARRRGARPIGISQLRAVLG